MADLGDIDDILQEWQAEAPPGKGSDDGVDPLDALVSEDWKEEETSLTSMEEIAKKGKGESESLESWTDEVHDAEENDLVKASLTNDSAEVSEWAEEDKGSLQEEKGAGIAEEDGEAWAENDDTSSVEPEEQAAVEGSWGEEATDQGDADSPDGESVGAEASDGNEDWGAESDEDWGAEGDDWNDDGSSVKMAGRQSSEPSSEDESDDPWGTAGAKEEVASADEDDDWGESTQKQNSKQNSQKVDDDDSWGEDATAKTGAEEDAWGDIGANGATQSPGEDEGWGDDVATATAKEEPAAWAGETAQKLKTAPKEDDWGIGGGPASVVVGDEALNSVIGDLEQDLQDKADGREAELAKFAQGKGPCWFACLPGLMVSAMVFTVQKPCSLVEPRLRPWLVEKLGIPWYDWATGFILTLSLVIAFRLFTISI